MLVGCPRTLLAISTEPVPELPLHSSIARYSTRRPWARLGIAGPLTGAAGGCTFSWAKVLLGNQLYPGPISSRAARQLPGLPRVDCRLLREQTACQHAYYELKGVVVPADFAAWDLWNSQGPVWTRKKESWHDAAVSRL